MRLDVFLSENGYAESRTEAKGYIVAGLVTVGGKPVTKPAAEVPEGAEITVDKSKERYASRGGLKLEAALDSFSVSPAGRLCLDIGASSGGFTDCLLKRGALHVIAVDSGSGQMVEYLRRDRRVSVVENFNARYMKPSDLEYIPSLTVMDVSFISATYIFNSVRECMPSGDFICLIKPQFEVGRSGLGKGGIVRDEKIRRGAVDKVVASARGLGFALMGVMESPVTGGDGNTEYLAHFRLGGEK